MTVTPLPLPPSPSSSAVAPTMPTYQPAPSGTPAEQPRVFAAIAAVMRDAMPVGKNQQNTQQNYRFRGIDDVMSAMAGPMRKHGVFILPTIAEHQQQRDGKMTRVLVTMRYHVYGPAGDCLIADMPGEAFDFADKATNKAQSAALKYLLFTLFMLPVDGRSIDDGDRDHPEQPFGQPAQQPQQGRRQQRQQRRQQNTEQQRRDYAAEARAAESPEQFAKVRAAAEKAGAPGEYLTQLDAIAAEKKAAAQQRKQETGTGATSTPEQQGTDRAHADAENALRLAASRANLPDLDNAFTRAFGKPISEAPAQTLHAFRQQIEAAAQQGAQQ